MYLVYDISDNNNNIHNSKLLSSTNDISEIYPMSGMVLRDLTGTVLRGFDSFSRNFIELGYCLYADDRGYRYLAIDTDFHHTNPVLIPFVRDYKISEII